MHPTKYSSACADANSYHYPPYSVAGDKPEVGFYAYGYVDFFPVFETIGYRMYQRQRSAEQN